MLLQTPAPGDALRFHRAASLLGRSNNLLGDVGILGARGIKLSGDPSVQVGDAETAVPQIIGEGRRPVASVDHIPERAHGLQADISRRIFIAEDGRGRGRGQAWYDSKLEPSGPLELAMEMVETISSSRDSLRDGTSR